MIICMPGDFWFCLVVVKTLGEGNEERGRLLDVFLHYFFAGTLVGGRKATQRYPTKKTPFPRKTKNKAHFLSFFFRFWGPIGFFLWGVNQPPSPFRTFLRLARRDLPPGHASFAQKEATRFGRRRETSSALERQVVLWPWLVRCLVSRFFFFGVGCSMVF